MTRTKSTAWMLAVALSATLLGVAVPALAQPRRIDHNARQILDYRLTLDSIRRLDAVMRTMDRVPDRGPSRSDLMLVNTLRSLDAWRDLTVDEIVRTIEPGHPDLVAAIRSAGLSTREYVLATMNLMLAYSAASQRRHGRGSAVTDVSDENVELVIANWYDVERTMRDLEHRMDAARRR